MSLLHKVVVYFFKLSIFSVKATVRIFFLWNGQTLMYVYLCMCIKMGLHTSFAKDSRTWRLLSSFFDGLNVKSGVIFWVCGLNFWLDQV